MATYKGDFSGRPYRLEVIVTTHSQSGNSSRMNWTLRAVSKQGYGSYLYDSTPFVVTINGSNYSVSHDLLFGPSGDYTGKTITLGSGTTGWIGHGSDGRKTVTVRARTTATAGVFGNADTGNNSYTFPRIPKTPSAPRSLSVGTTTPTTVALSWSSPSDNGGDSIDNYTIQYADNAGFSGASTVTSSGTSKTVTGLVAGPTYWFRVRANNGVGAGSWSSSVSATPALPEPTLTDWSQNTAGELVATWTPPAVTSGLTGYRVQIARDAGFSSSVVNVDLGDVTTYAHAGLAGGRRYWVRVAARTSGGVNAYSDSLDALLVLDAGDLDGWSRVGTAPGAIAYYTTEGIRRGTAGGAQALILESLATGAASLAADTFGIERTVTGLTPGAAYRFEATMVGLFPSAPTISQGATYRLTVDGTPGTPATLIAGDDTVELPEIEFVAASTSATLRIMLAEALTVAGAQDRVEQVALIGITLSELNTDYPQRLRSTVFESNLANHFDLACNSVGATWYVDRAGTTRFRLPGATLPVSAVFSDQPDPSAVSYVDIVAGYDTRTTVNRLEATNYGADETGDAEDNDDLVVEDLASQATFGVYRSSLSVNLYDQPPYDNSFQDRLDAVLDANSTPGPLVSQIRWNAQEDTALAKTLEVGQRITVRYRGTDYDSQIVALEHQIDPTRWIITLDLRPL